MKQIYPCICTICGVKNDFTSEEGWCQNGHDSWLEYRDIRNKNEFFQEAKHVFLLDENTLIEKFKDKSIKKLKVYNPSIDLNN